MKKELRKIFNKNPYRVNENFFNAFHKMLLLTADRLCTVPSLYHY
jgi:hypothetical protein